MKPRQWVVYALIDPRTDEIRYVGWTSDPKNRLKAHLRECKKGKTYKSYWLRELMRENIAPVFEIEETGIGDGYAAAERLWISCLRACGC